LRADHPDDADFVRAALRFFRTEPFFYTLAPALLPGPDPVDAFLFDSRRGFCEHYASSFVVLARAAGIPARVVTGYQGGEMNPTGGYMIVRQSDAHAWTEALIGRRWAGDRPTAARVDRGADRRPLAALRSHGGRGAVARRARLCELAPRRRAHSAVLAPRRR